MRCLLTLTLAAAATSFLIAPVPARSRAARASARMSFDDDDVHDWSPESLRERINAQGMGAQLGPATELLDQKQWNAAWVLIFNPGQEDEGVYTLQGKKSSPTVYVLAFEEHDEAWRFAQLLQADEFDLARPMEWGTGQLSEFCQSAGFEVGLVPTGTLLTPPAQNSYDAEAYRQLEEATITPEQAEEVKKNRDFLEGLWGL